MHVLITGAAGFLGGRLTKYLAERPAYRVTATSRRDHRAAEFAAAGARFVAFDADDPTFYERLCMGQEAVVHCAALSSPWGRYADFYDANVRLTERLLAASRRAGVQRFINISSPTVYNDYGHIRNARETDPLPPPVNHYSATKQLAERAVSAAHGPEFSTLSLRPRAIIGAEDTVIFPRLMRAYDAERLRVVGNGRNLVDFTAVHNLCSAIERALNAPPRAYGRAYNITNGKPESLWDIINELLRRLGRPPVEKRLPYWLADAAARWFELRARLGSGAEPTLTRYGVSVLARDATFNIDAAREHLGYAPPQTTADALAEFVAWYRDTEQAVAV